MLLFQDLAAIPLIAFAPLFATTAVLATASTARMDIIAVLEGLGLIAVVVVVGHFVLDYLLRLVALTRVKEAMTAAALLTVVGVTILMQLAGLSASLGAFIAGALLAESSYRHQLEADIQPFEGLLLGLFFTAIGMSIDVRLLLDEPVIILTLVAGLIVIKTAILYVLGDLQLQPANAIAKAAEKEGIAISDIDLFELNEAFAAVGIESGRQLGVSDDKINVNGGAIALGHPVGMSGARIVLHLAHELKRRGGGTGAAALCGGGGQGDALIIRVPKA